MPIIATPKIGTRTGGILGTVRGGSLSTGGILKPTQKTAFDTSTVEGLVQIAEQAGLKTKAQQLTQVGEDPEQIFSGGFIQDIFDTVNALQYGVVGVLQGKTFREGVKTRASYTKGARSIPEFIGGLAMDIFFDPLTWLGGAGLISKGAKGVGSIITKGGKAVRTAGEAGGVAAKTATNAFDFLGSKFTWAYGQPVYRNMVRRWDRMKYISQKEVAKMVEPLYDMGLGKVSAVFKRSKKADLIRRNPEELLKMVEGGIITPEQHKVLTTAWDMVDNNMNELQKLGMVSRKTRDAIGEYVTNVRGGKVSLAGWHSLIKRKNIPAVEKLAMDTITEAGGVTEITLMRQAALIDHGRFLQKVGQEFGEDAAIAGYKQLPDFGFGLASGKWLPETIADDLLQGYNLEKTWGQKAMMGFKYGKVILNPATHVRNKISNKFLNNMEGLPIWRMPDLRAKLFRDMAADKAGKFDDITKIPAIKGVKEIAEEVAPKLDDTLQPLAKEAQKYKTAEEFKVAATTYRGRKLYHISDNPNLIVNAKSPKADTAAFYGEGLYLTSEPRAWGFMSKDPKAYLAGKNVVYEATLSENARVATRFADKQVVLDWGKKQGLWSGRQPTEKLLKQYPFIDDFASDTAAWRVLNGEYLKAQGFDAYVPYISKEGQQLVVYNPKMVSIKKVSPATIEEAPLYTLPKGFKAPEELTDFFNKVKGGDVAKGVMPTNLLEEARLMGIDQGNFMSAELGGLRNLAKAEQGLKGRALRAFDWASESYQKSEKMDKLMMYYYQRLSKGVSPDEAYEVAMRATFNYSEVGPWVLKMRNSLFGFPFITFAVKSTPQVAKTLATHPERIARWGKFKEALENMADQGERKAERASEPDYIRDGFFIKLPAKDTKGRSVYFDMTYILPFGDIVAGQMFRKEKRVDSPLEAVFQEMPFANAFMELSNNEDFFGQQIYPEFGESHEIGGAIMQYLVKSYSPSLLEGAIDSTFDAQTRQELGLTGFLPARLGRSIQFEGLTPAEQQQRTTRTPGQELGRAFLGLKMTPMNVERERAKREKELREVIIKYLEEQMPEGDFSIFEKAYVPKDSSLREL